MERDASEEGAGERHALRILVEDVVLDCAVRLVPTAPAALRCLLRCRCGEGGGWAGLVMPALARCLPPYFGCRATNWPALAAAADAMAILFPLAPASDWIVSAISVVTFDLADA